MKASQNQPARYWAYSNYLVATSALLKSLYPGIADLVSVLSSSPATAKLHASPSANRERVAELLRSAWHTEALIAEALNHPALLLYSTPWTMVQTYYAIYQAARGYFSITDRSVTESHSATLTVLASDLAVCKGRFPSPWRSMCDDDPRKATISLCNDATAPPITLTNPTSSPYTNAHWQHFGLFLKTTRRRQYQERLADWRARNKRTRAAASVKSALISNLRPTTIFDALYRIRARSNYMDLDAFVFGARDESDARLLQSSLVEITQYTLCLFEYIVAKAAGRSWFENTVSAYLAAPTASAAVRTIGTRWPTIKAHI